MTPVDPHDPQAAPSRRSCQICCRPEALCVCRLLPDTPPVQNRTSIFILQHPRERFHPKGTVPLLRRGLQNVTIEVAHFDAAGEPTRQLTLPPNTGLLYPHARSEPLESAPARKRPRHLLLLDGTWGNAHRLYRCNPWLAQLPHFQLQPDAPGRYRIRGEPDPVGRSTVEAVAAALGVLEPDSSGLDRLIAAFDRMIEQQVEIIHREAAGPRRRVRPVRQQPLHGPLRARWQQVTLVYAESVASADGHRWPLHWTAIRPATGEKMEWILRGDAQPNARHLAHMELTPTDLSAGVTAETLRAAWNDFIGPEPVLTAWNQSTLDWVAPFTESTPLTVLLKAAYCNWRRRTSGSLAAVIAREGLCPPDLGLHGRAARRLAQALAVLEHLVPSGAAPRRSLTP